MGLSQMEEAWTVGPGVPWVSLQNTRKQRVLQRIYGS